MCLLALSRLKGGITNTMQEEKTWFGKHVFLAAAVASSVVVTSLWLIDEARKDEVISNYNDQVNMPAFYYTSFDNVETSGYYVLEMIDYFKGQQVAIVLEQSKGVAENFGALLKGSETSSEGNKDFNLKESGHRLIGELLLVGGNAVLSEKDLSVLSLDRDSPYYVRGPGKYRCVLIEDSTGSFIGVRFTKVEK